MNIDVGPRCVWLWNLWSSDWGRCRYERVCQTHTLSVSLWKSLDAALCWDQWPAGDLWPQQRNGSFRCREAKPQNDGWGPNRMERHIPNVGEAVGGASASLKTVSPPAEDQGFTFFTFSLHAVSCKVHTLTTARRQGRDLARPLERGVSRCPLGMGRWTDTYRYAVVRKQHASAPLAWCDSGIESWSISFIRSGSDCSSRQLQRRPPAAPAAPWRRRCRLVEAGHRWSLAVPRKTFQRRAHR